MKKFKQRYRIPSARADWWDYGRDGAYFITICTAHRLCLFGEIRNQQVVLSLIGEIVRQEWNQSFEIRTELRCDVYIIMPNHIHAILRLDHPRPVETHVRGRLSVPLNCNHPRSVETHGRASLRNGGDTSVSNTGGHYDPVVETHSRASLQNNGVAYRSPKSISSFVAGFKSSATKQINVFRNTPQATVWQSRFYDRIIRKEEEYWRIFHYIETNPFNWEQDELFSAKSDPTSVGGTK